MFDSIQKRLLLPLGGAVILILGGLTLFLTTRATSQLSQGKVEELRLESERLASTLNGEMKKNLKVSETLVSAMERYDREGADRTEANQMLRRAAEKNPNVLGTYLAYEPDAFDGRDYLYRGEGESGSNEEGRFAPYWNRFDGSLNLSPLEDLESQDWYTQPIQSEELVVKGPFVYDGRMMISYLHPIKRGEEPVGVGGVDVSVGYWQERARRVSVEESGYAFIVSSDGAFVAHPEESWIGDETLLTVADSLSIPVFRKIAEQVGEGRGGHFQFSDPVTGKRAEINLQPVGTGGFAAGVVVPQAEILAGVYHLRTLFLGLGAAALLLLLGLMFYLTRRSVVSPLQTVTGKVQAVTDGNTDVQIDTQREDEIGQLMGSFDLMVDQVREALDEARARKQEAQTAQEKAARTSEASQEKNEFLRAEIEDLTGRIERLSDGDLTVSFVGGGTGSMSPNTDQAAQLVGQLRAKLEEAIQSVRDVLADVASATAKADATARTISASSDQMAASTEEQSTQAEEVAAAVEELNQTIGENARSVQQTAEVAETGSQQAQRGGDIVREATGKMERIATAVEETAGTIERLGAYGDEIGRVVERIGEIADQTNLLALNAAIEAARAGEEGQGFAVVAEEVRELAEEADAATTEIEEMMEGVRAEIDEAIGTARQSSDQAEEGLELAEEAEAALEQIVEAIATVEEQADEIAAASEEQSTTSEEIAKSVQSMSTAARESAAGVTEVSDAATDLDVLTAELRDSVQQFEIEESGGEGGEGEQSEEARPVPAGDGMPAR